MNFAKTAIETSLTLLGNNPADTVSSEEIQNKNSISV